MFQEDIITEKISGSKLLIIDDNKTNLKVLKDFLSQYPFEVLIKHDSDNAIKLIKKEEPDLILLDIKIPKENGFQLCKKIKNHSEISSIPIVFLSALSDVDSIVKGFECGGIDFITKPVRQEVLLARVTTHLTLRKQQIELQKLNRAKDRFFSIISHDLRSPFMSLIGLTNLLTTALDEYNKKDILEIAEKLSSATRNTYSLLENLLEWSKIQYGAIDVVPEHTNINLVVKKVIGLFNHHLHEKSITVETKIDKELTAYVDENFLYTIFRNLMSNAIKFSNTDDKITIKANSVNDKVEISVIDEGEGISDKDLKKLVQFEKAEKKRLANSNDGSGIGLILCYELTKLSKGELTVSSKKGKGSKFTFTLPVRTLIAN